MRLVKNRSRMFDVLNLKGKVIIEVGVRTGRNAIRLNACQPSKLILVDVWRRILSETGYDDARHTSDKKWDEMYNQVVAIFKDNPIVQIVREFTPQAATQFPDHFADFIYIDADHREEPVYKDLIAWSRVLKIGGWMGGHDYFPQPSWSGVKPAVDKFLQETDQKLHIMTRADKFPSYAFMKQTDKLPPIPPELQKAMTHIVEASVPTVSDQVQCQAE